MDIKPIIPQPQIVKVAENNVQVTYQKTMTDVNGDTFQVYDTTDPSLNESYGTNKVNEQISKVQSQIDDWTNKDMEQYRQDALDKLNIKLTTLQTILTKLGDSNGTDGTDTTTNPASISGQNDGLGTGQSTTIDIPATDAIPTEPATS